MSLVCAATGVIRINEQYPQWMGTTHPVPLPRNITATIFAVMPMRAIETGLAIVECDETELIHVRFRPGVILSVKGLAEVRAARKQLAANKPTAVLATVPEDIDFELNVMNSDHYKGTDASSYTKVFAIVTNTKMHKELCALYATYFRTDFPLRTFDDEPSARAWLAEHMDPGAAR